MRIAGVMWNPPVLVRHSGVVIPVLQGLLICGVGAWLAIWLQPEPHSDWLYYWKAAGDADAYIRGGLGLWLLALPKALGLSPVVSSLSLNLPAAIWLLFLAYRLDPTRWRIFAQLVALYLLLIAPFSGIVQLDLMAAAQFGTGFWLLGDRKLGLSRGMRLALAVISIVFAVSTKPQYALVLWALLALCIPAALKFRRRIPEGFRDIVLVLLAGSMLGFAVDMAMRVSSGKTDEIRTSSAVTLYGGLLVSSDKRSERCGYWSVEAAQAAKDDMHKPLSQAVVDRLRENSVGHWLSIVQCKMPEILSPPSYALYWLIESPNVRARIDADPERDRIEFYYQRAQAVERKLYGWVGCLIIVACLWTAISLLRRGAVLGVLPALWLLGFWSVHTVFEIQGRYFLGLFVLAPLLCATVMRLVRATPAAGPMAEVLSEE